MKLVYFQTVLFSGKATKALPGIRPSLVTGYDHNEFTNKRIPQKKLDSDYRKLTETLTEVIDSVPSLKDFFRNNQPVERDLLGTNLLFRPIGQSVLINVLKAAIIFKKRKKAIEFFSQDNFNLNHDVWGNVFWDHESDTIGHQPFRQRYASLLIMEHLGINVNRTKKDKEVLEIFGFDSTQL